MARHIDIHFLGVGVVTSLRFSEKVLVEKAILAEYLEFAKYLAVEAGDTALN